MFGLRKGLEDAVVEQVFDADTNKDGKISLVRSLIIIIFFLFIAVLN